MVNETTISYEIGPRGKTLIMLPVRINGRGPYTFAFDTGAATTVIASDLAKRLRLPQGRQTWGLGSAGRHRIRRTKIASVELGGIVRKSVAAIVFDFGLLSEKLGRPIHGILGNNIFSRWKVTIDFAGKTLTIHKKANQQGTKTRSRN